LGAVRLPHEDAAVRGDEPVIRLGEVRGRVARLSRGAEDEQHLAFRAELMTACPLPAASGKRSSSLAFAERASATQTLPSLSTSIPWGHKISPAPKLCTTLPSGSSLTIGFASEPAHELTPHRREG